jgi:putrescine transport system permease protein
MTRMSLTLKVLVAGGLLFLYAPMVLMVIYSFNASKLVTVWGGFSTKWYASLMADTAILEAAKISLIVAATSATLAAMLGAFAGVALARFGLFRGRSIFSGMYSAPLVMPEVITGLSLLLLFVAIEQAIGWPQGRSVLTVVLAHTTLSAAFVAVVVQSRLKNFDASLEEAAADLGARPMTVFWRITLPLATPAIVAGWLLAFTLSLDDLVLASFTSGPGATTLPMLIYSKVRLGLSPEVNALATLILLLALGMAVLATWLTRPRDGEGAPRRGA